MYCTPTPSLVVVENLSPVSQSTWQLGIDIPPPLGRNIDKSEYLSAHCCSLLSRAVEMFNLIFRSALKTLVWAKSPSKTMGSELLPRWYYFFFALVELGGVFKYLFKVPAMVQPHTTSKISQVCCIAQLLVFQQCEIMCYQFSDLCNLSTFGFRGEALASLCAVSR